MLAAFPAWPAWLESAPPGWCFAPSLRTSRCSQERCSPHAWSLHRRAVLRGAAPSCSSGAVAGEAGWSWPASLMPIVAWWPPRPWDCVRWCSYSPTARSCPVAERRSAANSLRPFHASWCRFDEFRAGHRGGLAVRREPVALVLAGANGRRVGTGRRAAGGLASTRWAPASSWRAGTPSFPCACAGPDGDAVAVRGPLAVGADRAAA